MSVGGKWLGLKSGQATLVVVFWRRASQTAGAEANRLDVERVEVLQGAFQLLLQRRVIRRRCRQLRSGENNETSRPKSRRWARICC